MNAPSVDISEILEAISSLGLTFGTNLFIGREPTTPDNTVTIFDTPGSPPQLTYAQGENYYYPSIQIRVRNNSYINGYNSIKAIMDELHAYGPEAINGTVYNLIKCSQDPFLIDYDENGRARWICNFDIQRS
jgi:hypothetical protein